jgi:NADH dehydrogenase (ubiquinone) Fe-S protein 3
VLSHRSKASDPQTSESPFEEPTSPNPTLTKYADTTSSLHNYGAYITQCLPKFVQQFSVLKDELTIYTAPSGVIPILTFLRDHSQCQFKSAVDISGVDYPDHPKRFEVVYHLLSLRFGGRIRVKTYAGEGDAVPSAISVFSGANWYVFCCVNCKPELTAKRYEREAWDLYGIFFENHPDL